MFVVPMNLDGLWKVDVPLFVCGKEEMVTLNIKLDSCKKVEDIFEPKLVHRSKIGTFI